MFGGFPKSFTEAMRRREEPSSGEGTTIFVSIVSRMIITPAILLPLFYLYAINTQNIAVRSFAPEGCFAYFCAFLLTLRKIQDDPVFVVTAALCVQICLVNGSRVRGIRAYAGLPVKLGSSEARPR
jgi:hypothetical protein